MVRHRIQTHKLHKAIQKLNAEQNEVYKVNPLFKNLNATMEVNVSVAQTEKLIRKHIKYKDLLDYYLGLLHWDNEESSNGVKLGPLL